MIDLTGRSAVITGASSGIGRAIGLKLAAAGADVVVADLREDPREGGETTAALVRDLGRRAEYVECDVTDSASVAALIRTAVDTLGGLDIMVNNAGILVEGTIVDTPDELWRRQMAVNVDGTFYGCREAIRTMLALGRGGKIVNMTSISAVRGNPGFAAYCASKGAVLNLTRQLALDYASHGINVNAVAPGFVTTEMTAIYGEDIRGALARQTPRGRWATPDDIANAVLFLASPLSDHVVGDNLVVDGGWLIGTPVELPAEAPHHQEILT
jgi:3-oxoacyl-[acyl-carrier protein] reductase/meso-butanediol dehydrogenase/(S,S)-butanediol dehydrogenase/diacetyl reductase